MDVVFDTTHGKWNCSLLTDDTSNILEHTLQILIAHYDTRAFRVENYVGVQLCVCVGHIASVFIFIIGRGYVLTDFTTCLISFVTP